MAASVAWVGFGSVLEGTGYRVVRRIGSGASADVFEAVNEGGDRVAVKVLRASLLGSREAHGRFQRETRALASVQHPNLVGILDAGATASGQPFLVMPLLEGETLRERLRRGTMGPTAAAAAMVQVLAGLAEAHREGIVHRDVKPANIFLATEGAVVLDFGIAKLSDCTMDLTGEAHVVGTPRYLAPEQILAGPVDGRTDLYAAGVVLFEMLAGRGPFDAGLPAADPRADVLEELQAHVSQRPRNVRDFALVSAELDAIVSRAIEKRPSHRFPCASAFGLALERARARYLRRRPTL
jgi:eukaryotic-like serine/threonine-protein kinase